MAKLLNHNARIKDGQERHLNVDLTRRPFVVGADVDKHYVAFAVLFKDGAGHRSILRQYENYPKNLQEALQWILELSAQHNPNYPHPPHLYIESTGVYHQLTIHTFGNQVIPTLINPKQIKDLLKSEGKDDHKDALTLAKLALSFDLQGSRLDSYDQYRLKKAMRYHRKLIQMRTTISNRIGSTLTEAYLPIPNAIKVGSKTGLEMLAKIVEGETDRIALMKCIYGPPTEFIKSLDLVGQGKLSLTQALEKYYPTGSRKQHRTIDRLYRALELLPDFPDHVRHLLDQMLDHYQHLQGQIDIAHKRVEHYFTEYEIILPDTGELRTANDTISLLQTVPVFSEKSAQALIAEAGLDFDYTYPTAKKLTRYLGLTPGSKKSGGKVISTESVRGNNWFKPMIVQGATSFLRRRQVDVGQNLLDWGKEYQRATDAQNARVALARMAVKSAWHVVNKCEAYDDSRHKLVSQTRAVSTNISRLATATEDLERVIRPAHLNETGLANLTQAALKIGQLVGIHIPRYEVINFTPTPLADLNLKTATINQLAKHHLTTTSDLLLQLISGALPNLDGIGPKRFEEILTVLSTNHFIKILDPQEQPNA